jgi:hypothetical protein
MNVSDASLFETHRYQGDAGALILQHLMMDLAIEVV